MISPALPYPAAVTHRRHRLVFWIFMGFAAFYLIAEHGAHLAGLGRWLPLLILLACPALHLFGHGGHGGRGGHSRHGVQGISDAYEAPIEEVPPDPDSPAPVLPLTPQTPVNRAHLP